MTTQTIPVAELDKAGLVADNPSVNLPPNAFSDALNVRFKDGAVRKIKGHVGIFGDWDTERRILHTGYWANPNGATYIVVALDTDSSTRADVYTMTADSMGNASISKRSVNSDGTNNPMTHSDAAHWQTVSFNGGYSIIINNGIETPRHITDTLGGSSANLRTENLPGWDGYTDSDTLVSRVTAGNIIATGNLLLAGNLTEYDSEDRVHRDLRGVVRSSDVAEPGAIPNNWDPFQTAVNTADEIVIADTGQITAMAQLQGNIYVYTADSINQLRITTQGLQQSPVTSNYGCLGRDMLMEFDGSHLVVGSDDIYLFAGHPGNIQSVADGRVRRLFYEDAHYFYIEEGRIIRNQAYDEIWICYAPNTSGNGRYTTALIWNYRNNTWTKRDLPEVSSITVGPVPGGGSDQSSIAFEGTRTYSAEEVAGVPEVQTVTIQSGANAQDRLRRAEEQTVAIDNTAQITGARRVPQENTITVDASASVSDAHDRHETQSVSITGGTMRGADSVPESQTITVRAGLDADVISDGHQEQQRITLSGTDANTVDSSSALTHRYTVTFSNDEDGVFTTGPSNSTGAPSSVSNAAAVAAAGESFIFYSGLAESANYYGVVAPNTASGAAISNLRLTTWNKGTSDTISGKTRRGNNVPGSSWNIGGANRPNKLVARPDVDTHWAFANRQVDNVHYTTNTGGSWSNYSWSNSRYVAMVHTGSGGRWYALKRDGTLWHSTQGMPTSSSHWTQITTSGLSASSAYNQLRWLPHTQKLIVMMGNANGVGYVHGQNGTTFTSITSSGLYSGADEDGVTGTIFIMGQNGCRKTTNGFASSPSWSSVSLSGTAPQNTYICMVVHQGRGNWGMMTGENNTGATGAYASWTNSATSISRSAASGGASESAADAAAEGFVMCGYPKHLGRPIFVTRLGGTSGNGNTIKRWNARRFPMQIFLDQNTANVTPTAGGSARVTDWTYNGGTSRSLANAASDFDSAADTQFTETGYNASRSGGVVTLDTGQHTSLSGLLRYDMGSGTGRVALATNRTGRSKRNASLYQVRDERNQQIALLTATSRESRKSILSRVHSAIDGHTSSSTPAITWSAVLDSDNNRINLTSDGNTNVSGSVNVLVSNAATTGDYAAAADGDITSASSIIQNGAAPSAANATLNVLIPGATAAGDVNQSVTLSNTLPAYGSDPVNLNSDDIYDAVKAAVLGNSQTLWTIDTEDRARTVTFTGINNQTDFPSQAVITVTNANISGLTNADFDTDNNPRGVYRDGQLYFTAPDNTSIGPITIGDGTEGLTYDDTEIMAFVNLYLDSDHTVTDWTYNGLSNNGRTVSYTRTAGTDSEFYSWPDHMALTTINYGLNTDSESLGTGNTLALSNASQSVTQGLNVPAQTVTITVPGGGSHTISLANPDAGNNNQTLNATAIANAIRDGLSGAEIGDWVVQSGGGTTITFRSTTLGHRDVSFVVSTSTRTQPPGGMVTNVAASDFTFARTVQGYDTEAPVLRLTVPTDGTTHDITVAGDTDGTLTPISTLVTQIVNDLPTLENWTVSGSGNTLTFTGRNDTEAHSGAFALTVQSPGSLRTLSDPLIDSDVSYGETPGRDIYPVSVKLVDPEQADTEIIPITRNVTDGTVYNDSEIVSIIHDYLQDDVLSRFNNWTVTRADRVLTFTQKTPRVLNGTFSSSVERHPAENQQDHTGLATGNLSSAVTTEGRDATRAASVTITPLGRSPTTLTFDSETQVAAATRVMNHFNGLEGYTATRSGSTVTVTSQIFGGAGESSFAMTQDRGTQFEGVNNFRARDVAETEWDADASFALQETDPERPWPRDELNEARNYVVWSTDYDFHGGDLSYQFADTEFTSYIERRHFHMSPTKDVESLKAVGIHAMSDSDSETLQIAVTTSNRVQEPVDLTSAQYEFNLAQDYKVDVRETGRMLNIRVENTSSRDWELAGYDLEIGKGGER